MRPRLPRIEDRNWHEALLAWSHDDNDDHHDHEPDGRPAGPADPATNPATDPATLSGERADLLESLGKHRFFLRQTVRGLTDEQARPRPTVSALCLGGIVKHVTRDRAEWVRFIEQGAGRRGRDDTSDDGRRVARRLPMPTARRWRDCSRPTRRSRAGTDELVATVDLDAAHPLPAAPWFEPGARWSARRVLLHIIAETAQHAGHADIIRETIDGQKTMG